MSWETRLNSECSLLELGHARRLDLLATRRPMARRETGSTARLAWRLGSLLIALGRAVQHQAQRADLPAAP